MKLKKGTAIMLALIMALSAFAFAACGGGNGIEGTYELESAEASGVTIDKAMAEEYGLDISFEFKKNGKMEMFISGESQGDGTYKIDGENIALSDSTDTIDAKLSENNTVLTFTEPTSGVVLVLKKA